MGHKGHVHEIHTSADLKHQLYHHIGNGNQHEKAHNFVKLWHGLIEIYLRKQRCCHQQNKNQIGIQCLISNENPRHLGLNKVIDAVQQKIHSQKSKSAGGFS